MGPTSSGVLPRRLQQLGRSHPAVLALHGRPLQTPDYNGHHFEHVLPGRLRQQHCARQAPFEQPELVFHLLLADTVANMKMPRWVLAPGVTLACSGMPPGQRDKGELPDMSLLRSVW